MGDQLTLPDAPKDDDWNMGALFAHYLVGTRSTIFSGSGAKTETVGSLLTPIMQFCGVPLRRFRRRDGAALKKKMDASSLAYSGIIRNRRRYEFIRADGAVCHLALPCPEFTRIDSVAAFDFRPPAERVTVITPPPVVLPEAEHQPPIRSTRSTQPARHSTSQPRVPRADDGVRFSTSALPDYFELPEQPAFTSPPEEHFRYQMERDRRQFRIWRWLASAFTGCRSDQAPREPRRRTSAEGGEDQTTREETRHESVDPLVSRPTDVPSTRREDTLHILSDPVRLSALMGDPLMMSHTPQDFYFGTGSSTGFDPDFERQRSRSPRD